MNHNAFSRFRILTTTVVLIIALCSPISIASELEHAPQTLTTQPVEPQSNLACYPLLGIKLNAEKDAVNRAYQIRSSWIVDPLEKRAMQQCYRQITSAPPPDIKQAFEVPTSEQLKLLATLPATHWHATFAVLSDPFCFVLFVIQCIVVSQWVIKFVSEWRTEPIISLLLLAKCEFVLALIFNYFDVTSSWFPCTLALLNMAWYAYEVYAVPKESVDFLKLLNETARTLDGHMAMLCYLYLSHNLYIPTHAALQNRAYDRNAQQKHTRQCPICLDEWTRNDEQQLLFCGHRFCVGCLNEYERHNRYPRKCALSMYYKCPVCAQQYNSFTQCRYDYNH